MVSANLGSIADRIVLRIPDIPSSVSGALVSIIDDERLFMEEFTGNGIGSVGIAEKYQPALLSLSCAAVIRSMQLEGTDATSFTLGDLSVERSSNSQLSKTGDFYYEDGMRKLKRLGTTLRFKRVIS